MASEFIEPRIGDVGEFQSLTFKGVGQEGWDVYDSTFANGELEWRIAPLSADGKVVGLWFHERPGTYAIQRH